MEFPLGQETLNEYIKEYLSFNEFKNTYDCFTAELRSRKVSTKLINKTNQQEKPQPPRIYEFLKDDNAKTNKENNLEAQLYTINRSYKQILLSARSILSVSIGIIEFIEENSEKLKGTKDFEEKLQNYKLNLTKFHSIVLGNSEKKEEINLETIKKAKQEIFEKIEKERVKLMLEHLLEIRLGLLRGKVENRRESIKNLIEIDVLRIKEEEKFESFNKILELNDHTLSTCLYSLTAMIASCEEGISYLTGQFTKPDLILTVFKTLKQETQNSTLKRFSLAILQKISAASEMLEILLKNEVLTWLVMNLNTLDTNEEYNHFFANYSTAFLLNSVLYLHENQANFKDFVPGGAEFIISLAIKLINFQKLGFLALYNNLLILASFFKKDYLNELQSLNFYKKIKDFFGNLKTRDNLNDHQKTSLQDLATKAFSLSPQDENLELLLSQKSEYRKETLLGEIKRNNVESLVFEVFPDEIY